MTIVDYLVADNLIRISFDESIDLLNSLPSFKDFKVETNLNNEAVVNIELTLKAADINLSEAKLLSDVSIVWGDRFKFEEITNFYVTSVENLNSRESDVWRMISDKEFKESKIHVKRAELYDSNILSWMIMVAFGQRVLSNNTALIHSSVVENGEYAVSFLGKSGTGKSTHSRLWISTNEGFNLLNDDNPAVRIEGDDVFIYGTPWSGKTACYINKKRKLMSIIRLTQAKENKMDWKNKGVESLLALLPSFTAIRWNQTIFSSMLSVLENIIQRVSVGQLYCLPNPEAAELCYNEIIKVNKLEDE
ncbi:hypothetical protein M3B46_03755 [Sphingobacterium daejeonense]|uniref:hypothetical protein n=1 Tax=Sphingobacterium daejeonense TaxID=371142 RepID=UPI0021A3F958|nr:hypothetical protein [Sphingobacterium daejeonense]MCT1530093.1 hypothetical protein [Sphingobacterium daejeonense]